jgi:hypothetical protein
MLRFKGGNVRDSGEHISAMGRRSLDTVSEPCQTTPTEKSLSLPVVDTPLASFVVDVKVLQVVVEINAPSAEVSSEQGSMRSENGRHVNVALPAERNGKTSLPLVEVGDDRFVSLASRELPDKLSRRLQRTESSPRRGTKPRCSRRRWSRWSRGR